MKTKQYKEKYEKKLKKYTHPVRRIIDVKWIAQITILAFFIAIFFSGISDYLVREVNIILGIIIIIFFIVLGVIFDMVGISVTSAKQAPFNTMASKKIKGSKTAIKLLQNAEKVSAFCNDVIGDICNVITGAAGVVIATTISGHYNIDLLLTVLIINSVIAATTIGGKASGKAYAINKSEIIVYKVAKMCNVFVKKRG